MLVEQLRRGVEADLPTLWPRERATVIAEACARCVAYRRRVEATVGCREHHGVTVPPAIAGQRKNGPRLRSSSGRPVLAPTTRHAAHHDPRRATTAGAFEQPQTRPR